MAPFGRYYVVSPDKLDLLLYDSYGKYYGKYSKYNGMNSTHQINIDRLDLSINDDRNKLKNVILYIFKEYINNKRYYDSIFGYRHRLEKLRYIMPDVEFVFELFEDIVSHINNCPPNIIKSSLYNCIFTEYIRIRDCFIKYIMDSKQSS